MKPCIVYMRASTNEELQSNSFGVQELAVKRYCEQFGYEPVATYSEYVSASKDKVRPEWNKALLHLRKDKDLTLISWEVTRISRDLKDWATIEPLLHRMRFTDCLTDETPTFLLVSLKILMGQHESKKLGERISDGIARLKDEHKKAGKEFKWGNAHNISYEDRLAGPKANVEKADALKDEVERALKPVAGLTLAKKVEYLNTHTTVRTRRGNEWTIGNLHRVLSRS